MPLLRECGKWSTVNFNCPGGGALKGSLVEVCRQGFQSNPDSGLGGNLIFENTFFGHIRSQQGTVQEAK